MAEPKEVMTPKQVAEYLQLHVMTIYRHIHDGKLAATKIGGRYRIKRQHVEELLSETNSREEESQDQVNHPRLSVGGLRSDP